MVPASLNKHDNSPTRRTLSPRSPFENPKIEIHITMSFKYCRLENLT